MAIDSYKILTIASITVFFVFLSGCLGPEMLVPEGEGRVFKITSIINVKAASNIDGAPMKGFQDSVTFYKMKGSSEIRENKVSGWYSDYGTARFAFTYDLRPGEWIRVCVPRGLGSPECQQIISYYDAQTQADEIGQLTVTRQINVIWNG